MSVSSTSTPTNSPTLASFRAKVHAYCREAAKTQRDLAERLGLSYMALSKKLTGQRTLTKQEAGQIILALVEWQLLETLEEVAELCHLSGYPTLFQSLSAAASFTVESGLVVVAGKAAKLSTKSGSSDPGSAASVTNLPQPSTSFIGRQKELGEVQAVLSQHRWVSLAGPAGCGKTRLALEAGRLSLPYFKEGVWLVELAALGEAQLVPQLLANTLGVKAQGRQTLEEALTYYLKDRQLLLVLDNCEHLIAPLCQLVELLLSRCEKLVIMTTSREKLASPMETLLEIGPMTVPPLSSPLSSISSARAGGSSPKLKELRRYDSILLFETRARQALASFKLEGANALAVQDVCQRLDGIPLALELAASRLSALSINQIKTRLDERFRLLKVDNNSTLYPHQNQATAPVRLAQARHQTLEALIDWSYELLTEAEQEVFRRLSIFADGCTLTGAEAVCEMGSGRGNKVELNLPVLLASLSQKNLLRQWDGSNGKRRYGMLQTVREYGRVKLVASFNYGVVQAQANAYLLQLVETVNPLLTGSAQISALRELDSEYANLRQVLSRSLEDGAAELAVRLGLGLASYWQQRRYGREARAYLEQILTFTNPLSVARAELLNRLGIFYWDQADYEQAVVAFEEALAIGRQKEDLTQIGAALSGLGKVAWVRGNYPLAQQHFEENLAIQRQLGDNWGLANAFSDMGNINRYQSNYAQAAEYIKESLALMRQLGNIGGIGQALQNLGVLSNIQNDYEQSSLYYEESLALREQSGHKSGVAFALANLGINAGELHEYDKAHNYFEKSLILLKELGEKHSIATVLYGRGRIFRRQQLYEEAQHCFEESLAIRRQINNKRGIASSLLGLATLAELKKDYWQAYELLKPVLTLAVELGEPLVLDSAIFLLAVVFTRIGVEGDKGKASFEVAGLKLAAQLLGAKINWYEKTNNPLDIEDQQSYEEISEILVQQLGREVYAASFNEGKGLSLAEAARLGLEFEVGGVGRL